MEYGDDKWVMSQTQIHKSQMDRLLKNMSEYHIGSKAVATRMAIRIFNRTLQHLDTVEGAQLIASLIKQDESDNK